MRVGTWALALAGWLGCSSAHAGCSGTMEQEAGKPDSGQPDAGPPDAGPPDAGPPDAGPPDAGPPDAGPPVPVLKTPSSADARTIPASETVLSASVDEGGYLWAVSSSALYLL